MKKVPLTPERAAKVFQSVQFMYLMAEMIKIEFQTYMDVDFRNPVINNFAGKIIQSATAIQTHLSSLVKAKDSGYREDYTIELHRVFQLFVGLDLEKIQEFMDGVDAHLDEVEPEGIEEKSPNQ